jgi:spore coat polysaccharide biosynthesis predicted glycosyltransferase SpsG
MLENLPILIRTSGGLAPREQLGFGHIYRSTNLADQLRPNKIHFLVEDFGGAKKVIASRGYRNVQSLKKGISLESDIKETLKTIQDKKIDILIIDRYKLKKQYVRQLSKFVKTVVISDLRLVDFPAHLVINGFIGFTNQIRVNRFGTKLVLGPRYQILNKNFARVKNKKKMTTLLATFGGFDENNIVETLLESAEPYLEHIKLRVVLGPATTRSLKIADFEKRHKNDLTVIQRTEFMHKEIANAKYGVCAGGITSYEFAALKVPFAIISQVEHQLITAREWEKKNIAYNLGGIGKSTQRKIDVFLDKIITKTVKLKNAGIIDGFGSKRAAREILKLI